MKLAGVKFLVDLSDAALVAKEPVVAKEAAPSWIPIQYGGDAKDDDMLSLRLLPDGEVLIPIE